MGEEERQVAAARGVELANIYFMFSLVELRLAGIGTHLLIFLLG